MAKRRAITSACVGELARRCERVRKISVMLVLCNEWAGGKRMERIQCVTMWCNK